MLQNELRNRYGRRIWRAKQLSHSKIRQVSTRIRILFTFGNMTVVSSMFSGFPHAHTHMRRHVYRNTYEQLTNTLKWSCLSKRRNINPNRSQCAECRSPISIVFHHPNVIYIRETMSLLKQSMRLISLTKLSSPR